jgi:hypothetical protein
MYAEITIVANAPSVIQDILGLEATTPEATFTRASVDGADTVIVRCSGSVWDRLRPQLRKLSQIRIPAVDANGAVIPMRTRPAITYSMEWVPGDRPRIHRVDGAISVAGGAALTVYGENLIPGRQARLDIYRERVNLGSFSAAGKTPLYNKPELMMTFTAVQKGPGGNNIGIWIKEEQGAGSVTVEEYADGKVLITIVPAAGASDTTSIAAQVAGSPLASEWISATAVIPSQPVAPFTNKQAIVGPNVTAQRPFRFLTGGDGTGVAFADLLVSGTNPANRLHIRAQRAGNQGNLINVKILANQIADTVTVTGNAILVRRVAATTTLADLAAAINSNASATALVHATAMGVGSLGDVEQTYLACGAGEQASAQIGGAPATITQHTDTSMLVSATPAALAAAGVTAGAVTHVNILLDYQRLQSSMLASA